MFIISTYANCHPIGFVYIHRKPHFLGPLNPSLFVDHQKCHLSIIIIIIIIIQTFVRRTLSASELHLRRQATSSAIKQIRHSWMFSELQCCILHQVGSVRSMFHNHCKYEGWQRTACRTSEHTSDQSQSWSLILTLLLLPPQKPCMMFLSFSGILYHLKISHSDTLWIVSNASWKSIKLT